MQSRCDADANERNGVERMSDYRWQTHRDWVLGILYKLGCCGSLRNVAQWTSHTSGVRSGRDAKS